MNGTLKYTKPSTTTENRNIGGVSATITVPFVQPAAVKSLLDANATKSGTQRAAIRFIDCQDAGGNAGKQFENPLHLLAAQGFGGIMFTAKIGRVPTIMSYLAGADVVIIYCQQGVLRSPEVWYHYTQALKGRQDLNPNQFCAVLSGGMENYAKLPSPTGIKPWVKPENAFKILSLNGKTGIFDAPAVPKPDFLKPGETPPPTDWVTVMYTDTDAF